jgi:hypothetical protein
MKHIIATLVIIAIAIIVWRQLYHENYHQTQRTCGKVAYKGGYDQMHKYSSHYTFIFVVDVDGEGKRDFDVSASTWTSYNVGDRICFNPQNTMLTFLFICSLCSAGVIVFCGFIWFLINMNDFIHD